MIIYDIYIYLFILMFIYIYSRWFCRSGKGQEVDLCFPKRIPKPQSPKSETLYPNPFKTSKARDKTQVKKNLTASKH